MTSTPCARNLPQHFNGCTCSTASGSITAEAEVDLAITEPTSDVVSLTEVERARIRIAVDRNETPGASDHITDEHLFAAVEEIISTRLASERAHHETVEAILVDRGDGWKSVADAAEAELDDLKGLCAALLAVEGGADDALAARRAARAWERLREMDLPASSSDYRPTSSSTHDARTLGP